MAIRSTQWCTGSQLGSSQAGRPRHNGHIGAVGPDLWILLGIPAPTQDVLASGDVWKLQHSMTLESPRLDITVKHVGSDDWTPVRLWKHSGFPRDLQADLAIGTDFKHGDQLNMRYIYTDGQSHPVSFDGTEATNCFPLTIRVIGQVG